MRSVMSISIHGRPELMSRSLLRRIGLGLVATDVACPSGRQLD
jgi:hypothetical protein